MLKALWSDEAGVTTVEYALMLALVSIVAIAAWQLLGTNVSGTANNSATAVQTGTAPATP